MSAFLTYGAELALFNQFAEALAKAVKAHCAAKGDETALLAMRAVADMISAVELAASHEIRDRAREEVELALETMEDAGAKPTHPLVWLPEAA